MPDEQPRVTNRSILVGSVVLCILIAVALAWLLGVFA